MINVKRLGQVLVGAALKRRHRTLQIGVGGHDNHRQLRIEFLRLLQEFQTGFSRHTDIADDHLR